jgi:hypothetical protein
MFTKEYFSNGCIATDAKHKGFQGRSVLRGP